MTESCSPLGEAEAATAGTYGRLRSSGLAAVNTGRFEEARSCFDQAWRWARAHGDEVLVDRAFCNRVAVTPEVLGDDSEVAGSRLQQALPRLREILSADRNLLNSRLAAYNLARIYEHRREQKKGLFYARIALDRSKLLERRAWIASSHHQIGNHLLAECYFDQAEDHYRRVLDLMPPKESLARLLAFGSLGHCLSSQGRLRNGLQWSYRALRGQRQFPAAKRVAMTLHQDLCFGLLESGRLRAARRHGERGLKLAEAFGAHQVFKSVSYLLGQVAIAIGDPGSARRLYDRLQKRYYPNDPNLGNVLMAFDLRALINLRA